MDYAGNVSPPEILDDGSVRVRLALDGEVTSDWQAAVATAVDQAGHHPGIRKWDVVPRSSSMEPHVYFEFDGPQHVDAGTAWVRDRLLEADAAVNP